MQPAHSASCVGCFSPQGHLAEEGSQQLDKNNNTGPPGWDSRLSIRLLVSAQVGISGSWDRAPGWAPPSAGNLLEILFPSVTPTCVLTLSPSLK